MLKNPIVLWCLALICLIAVTCSSAQDADKDDQRPFAGIVKRPGARFLGGGSDFWGGRGMRSVYRRRFSPGGVSGRWDSVFVPQARKRPSYYVPMSSYFKDDDDENDDDDADADVRVPYAGYGKRARYAYPSWLRNGRYSG